MINMIFKDFFGFPIDEIFSRLTPLREINYQDIHIGDIFVKVGDADDPSALFVPKHDDGRVFVIKITGKYIEDGGRYGDKMLIYDIFTLLEFGKVKLEIENHNYSYEGLLKERLWEVFRPLIPIISTLNYPDGLS